MDDHPPKQSTSEEVSSMEWEFIKMSEQEEDLIYRMYKLVGNRWDLIAGRIPGRKAEEIERFWIMKHSQAFSPIYNKDSTSLKPSNWDLDFEESVKAYRNLKDLNPASSFSLMVGGWHTTTLTP